METVHAYFGTNLSASIVLLLSILLMETLLSIDNAAALALIVRKLPEKDQGKALEYGMLGAFVMRFASIFFVSYLANFWFIKIIGGAYLIFLAYKHFTSKDGGDDEVKPAEETGVFAWASKYISIFWSTVIVVELMDMVFSVDNIFAVTAMTKYTGLIIVAVGIGIVSMRFVSRKFIKLMEIMPWLEDVAFVVIGLLGVKLALTLFEHYVFADTAFMKYLATENADHVMSYLCLAIFTIPVLTCLLFNWPAKSNPPVESELLEEAEETLDKTE